VTETAIPSPSATVDRLRGRDRTLDGLRALAAIAVIFTHAGDWTDSVTGPHALWIQELNVGVDVFFVISAVLLYAPFVRAHLDGRSPPGARDYAFRRITRIYPAYWAALLVILPLSPIFGLNGRWQWFSVPLLIHTYQPAGLLSSAGLRQSWTLVVEISFYAFLPFYAAAVRALGARVGALRAEVTLAVVLLVVGPACFWLSTSSAGVQLPYVLRILPPHLGIFAAGMLIVIAREAVARAPHEITWWRVAGTSAVPWFAVALLMYWIVCAHLGLDARVGVDITARQQLAQLLLETVLATCVVAPAVVVTAQRSRTLRIIGCGPLAFTGMVSYGVYLWHYAVIEWLVRRMGCHPGAFVSCPPSVHWSFVKVGLAAIPLSIAAGAASWYLVERPCIRLTHRSARSRSAAAPAVH
jgi:peptidoglycan/LPS O-acetylase OafA/YrhL